MTLWESILTIWTEPIIIERKNIDDRARLIFVVRDA